MPLSIERAALVRRLVTQGYHTDQVANLLRIERSSVLDVMQRAGRDAAIKAERAKGKTIRQIAAQFHVGEVTVRRIGW
jgi:transposase